MTTSRRAFLQRTAALSALAAIGAPALAARAGRGDDAKPAAQPGAGKAAKPLSILILGGTGFLGPHCVDACHARGHKVTIFNRGLSEKRRQIHVDAEEELVGDRDPDKGDGLKALEGRKFDAVIDNSGQMPRHVKASADLLAKNAGLYLFTSTLSVYKDNSKPDNDESAELADLAEPENEDPRRMDFYGGRKALCEKHVSDAFGKDRAILVRPGFIIGPGDPFDRFTYWAVRTAKAGEDGWGAEILAPGTANDPVQFIDVRDLIAFMLHLVENKTVGTFNATGPDKPTSLGTMLAACQNASGKKSTVTYVPYDFLEAHGPKEANIPITVPTEGEYAGFARRSIAKSVAAGLKTRPIEETARDTAKWWPGEVDRRRRVYEALKEQAKKDGKPEPKTPDPTQMNAGLKPDQEQAILKDWHEKNG